jgi:hypothetical protein
MTTLYIYDYNNSDGGWKRLKHDWVRVFELWVDGEPDQFSIAGNGEDYSASYSYDEIVWGPSPDCRIS